MKRLCVSILALALCAAPALARPRPADTVFINGRIHTVDALDTVAQSLAVRDGRLVYVGDDGGAKAFVGRRTRKIDLEGRTVLPGLIDGHMHPQSGGLRELNCNLRYEPLTVAEFQAKIQQCLDAEPEADAEKWLVVINWYEQAMQPPGMVLSHADLDTLRTARPIMVRSSFGHSNLTNRRGLDIAGITRDTPNPKDGIIQRDASGEATGRFEDAAQDLISRHVPAPDAATNLKATQIALKMMREQGITTFLDAYTDVETLTAYREVMEAGGLTARGHFGVLIDAGTEYDAGKAVAEVLRQKQAYERLGKGAGPGLRIHTAKLFLDGVVAAPSLTGVMVAPYFENMGTKEAPHWRPGKSRGPQPYFTDAQLQDTLIRLSDAGIDPHMHADGDGAVRQALDAVAALRAARPQSGTRPAIAHAELVDPADYSRFAELDALPVLSFQWGKPGPDTVDTVRDYLGPARHALFEPSGLLDIYGARVVFGSDWPVDTLNEWLALQIAVTRRAVGADAEKYPDRLGVDPGLSVTRAIHAMTIDAAYSLHQETETGSLETGKLADLIVIDRDLFAIPPEEIGGTKVLMTLVGGQVVYDARGF
jgi:predicted amidohydrolase YtcJ